VRGKKRIVGGREVGEIDRSSVTGRIVFYFIYVVSLFRLLGYFYISISSLYFFGKYDVMLVIVIVLLNNI